jgi:hypothetical protein
MTKDEAIRHYGTQQALADALGIKQSSVAEWGEYPPELRQIQLEMLTGKKLRAERGVLPTKQEAA